CQQPGSEVDGRDPVHYPRQAVRAAPPVHPLLRPVPPPGQGVVAHLSPSQPGPFACAAWTPPCAVPPYLSLSARPRPLGQGRKPPHDGPEGPEPTASTGVRTGPAGLRGCFQLWRPRPRCSNPAANASLSVTAPGGCLGFGSDAGWPGGGAESLQAECPDQVEFLRVGPGWVCGVDDDLEIGACDREDV